MQPIKFTAGQIRHLVVTRLLPILLLAASAQASADHLLLTYIEKPPLYYTDSAGKPAGLLLERVQAAFSGRAYMLESRSPRRALAEIQADRGPICSIGWFKTPERESFALFSEPIHQEAPLLAVVRAKNRDALANMPTLKDLLASPNLRVGVVAGFSYGDKLDNLLQPIADRLDTAPNVSSNLRKLVAWRVDTVLVDPDDLDYYLKDAQIQAEDIVALRFPDMPHGEPRFLMCSRKTPLKQLQQFNAALRRLQGGPAPLPRNLVH